MFIVDIQDPEFDDLTERVPKGFIIGMSVALFVIVCLIGMVLVGFFSALEPIEFNSDWCTATVSTGPRSATNC